MPEGETPCHENLQNGLFKSFPWKLALYSEDGVTEWRKDYTYVHECTTKRSVASPTSLVIGYQNA